MKRGWKDSPFFQDEPYSERDAWEWMIEEAAFKEKTIAVLGNPVALKRGQFCHSIRFMAEKFQWSIGKVQRFVKRLQKWSMIHASTDTGQVLISISNYSKYQEGKYSGDTSTDTQLGTTPDTPTGTNNKKDKEGKKVKNKRAAQAPLKPEDVSHAVWEDFKNQRKTKITNTALDGIRKQAEKAGWTFEDALREAVTRGWQSFKAEWVNNERKDNGKSKGNADDELRNYLGSGGR